MTATLLHILDTGCWCDPATAVDGHVNEDGTAARLDLGDTTNCDLDWCCATCSTEEDNDLVIGTATTPVGVLCFTLCRPCADESFVPRIGFPAAAASVLDHCGHLDINLESMAAALRTDELVR